MIKGIIAGAFDVIHPGYIKMFKEAKQHCDSLVILLHTDPSIERPEKLKAVLSTNDRKDILMSIKYIDDVIRLMKNNYMIYLKWGSLTSDF